MKRWRRTLISDQFHKIFYRFDERAPWRDATWLGVPALKNPFDLWVYQEIICELRPEVIIECGTYRGGSALFLASICDQVGQGRVVSIDVKVHEGRPQHPRITYLHGSSIAPEMVSAVQDLIGPGDTVMAILDSDHKKAHVLQEMQIYSRLVTVGSYLIVEDTNINGHPVWPDYGPGPKEAVDEFTRANDQFVIDHAREKFYLTFNPGGYLKRVK